MQFNELLYAGHSATLVKGSEIVVGIDPWLEGNPKCPAELKNPPKLDLIVLTHGHSDHAGDAVRLAKKYNATVVATYELGMLLIGQGVPKDKIVAMNKGGTASILGVSVTFTHAIHSNSFETAAGLQYAGEACGVVLSDGNLSLYHAGDTALFSDIALIARRYRPQVALLPVGDFYTMGPSEAAEAASLLRCRLVIPIHHGTFPDLSGTGEQFVRECTLKEIRAREMKPGEAISLVEFRKAAAF